MTQGSRRRRVGGCVIASLFLISAMACTGSNSTTATAATSTRTSDTFSGTVAVGGHDVHNFSAAAAGTIDVTLTAVTPASTAVMGISVGLAGDGGCSALAGASVQAVAGSAAQLSGIVTLGTLCVDVHDVGTLSAPVGYTVTVVHP
ncbi:MAG: hypothetical protein JWL71_4912 [Acidobacteria bacterium]|nr:hypothetical protein [Acidobacteriota bacterium]